MDLMEMWKLIYQEELPLDIGPIRELLEEYSSIESADIDSHLYAIRKKAWNSTRYPCVGRWRFLYVDPSSDTRYQQVLSRLTSWRSSDVLLDLGCGVGQSLRQFAHDGVHPSKLIGLDINPGLIEIGFELFRDRHRTPASFIVGDMMDDTDEGLERIDGRISIVHASNFWHLFNWTQQLAMAIRMVRFFKVNEKRAMVYGRQVGTVKAGAQSKSASSYLHDQKTFQRLWDDVGALTDTSWRVEMEFLGERLAQIPGFNGETMAARYGVYQIK
ncbi:hypothetical protein jhhlp_008434 [Lomentospora prolificans]|uniref:Methyltransferase domain-containing protein n=1 Tax=Lomentospora prolificans TaxID=41688 RepID=A0A2N3MY18_9PEZI|nr:hypothetical protein jhhlp_008434 [Lomentospora prolificans]